jgi:hypothetical protein
MHRSKTASLDHLVGDGKYSWRNCKAERLRGLEMNHQLEFSRLQDRQVGGLVAIENAASVDAKLAIHGG